MVMVPSKSKTTSSILELIDIKTPGKNMGYPSKHEYPSYLEMIYTHKIRIMLATIKSVKW